MTARPSSPWAIWTAPAPFTATCSVSNWTNRAPRRACSSTAPAPRGSSSTNPALPAPTAPMPGRERPCRGRREARLAQGPGRQHPPHQFDVRRRRLAPVWRRRYKPLQVQRLSPHPADAHDPRAVEPDAHPVAVSGRAAQPRAAGIDPHHRSREPAKTAISAQRASTKRSPALSSDSIRPHRGSSHAA